MPANRGLKSARQGEGNERKRSALGRAVCTSSLPCSSGQSTGGLSGPQTMPEPRDEARGGGWRVARSLRGWRCQAVASADAGPLLQQPLCPCARLSCLRLGIRPPPLSYCLISKPKRCACLVPKLPRNLLLTPAILWLGASGMTPLALSAEPFVLLTSGSFLLLCWSFALSFHLPPVTWLL